MKRLLISQKNHLIFIFLWLGGMDSWYFYHTGIGVANDTARYVDYASQVIATGNLYQPHNVWYLSYVLFIAACKYGGGGMLTIVVCQCILQCLSVWCLYRAAYLVGKNSIAALLAAFIFLLQCEPVYWNFYILTESFFCSMICITLYLWMLHKDKPGFWSALFLMIGLVVTFFARPTGIVIVVAVVLEYLISKREKFYKISGVVYVILLPIVFACLYMIVNKMLATFYLVENYQLGEIVFGVTTLPELPSIGMLTVDAQIVKSLPPEHYSPIVKVAQFVYWYPVFFIKLFELKVLWYLMHVKPYYSTLHNTWIIITLWGAYFLAIKSVVSRLVPLALSIILLVVVAGNCIIIGLTAEDWDGRFLLPLLPLLAIAASYGGVSLIKDTKIYRALSKFI